MNLNPHDCASLLQCLQDYEKLATDTALRDVEIQAATLPLAARVRIAGEDYAVALDRIRNVLRRPRIVAVPGAPTWIPGAVRVGQQMLAVLRGEWALERSAPEHALPPELAIVLELGRTQVALLVDAVGGLHNAADGSSAGDAALTPLDLDHLALRIDEQVRGHGRSIRHSLTSNGSGDAQRVGS